MTRRKPLTNEEGEVREITAEDLKHFKPFKDLPQDLQETLKSIRRPRGPQVEPTKERITIRLSHEVLEHFRSGGKGWQTRLDQMLLDMVHGKKPA